MLRKLRMESAEMKMVSLEEWVSMLEESGQGKGFDIEKNLALKLLGFYQDLSEERESLRMNTKEMKKVSETSGGWRVLMESGRGGGWINGVLTTNSKYGEGLFPEVKSNQDLDLMI